MAERERRLARPYGGTFHPRVRVMDADDLDRARRRMAGEIIERNEGTGSLVLIGLQTGGVPIAAALAEALTSIGGVPTDVGSIDVAFYRDDIGLRQVLPEAVTDIPWNLDGKVVVLCDDVLFTGRTIRAALNALADYGRPRAVQLAVLVDRGHRQLPIRADYVGKNLPTSTAEKVQVRLTEHDGLDVVRITGGLPR